MVNPTLEGLLLSDGCLQRAPRSQRWHYQQTCREPTLLEWVRGRIPGTVAPVRGPYGRSGYYRIRTRVDVLYGEARDRWYPDGRKIIPPGFAPCPENMAAAFLGDGSLRQGASGRLVRFATCAFSRASVDRLAEQLRDLGFDATVHRLREPYHEVCVRAASVDDFLRWLGPCPVPEYEYKWGAPGPRLGS